MQLNALFLPLNILIIPPFLQLYYQIGLLYYKIRKPFRRTLVCWCKNVRDDISTSRVESTSRCEYRRRFVVMDRCDNIRSREGIQLVGTNLSNLMPGYLLPPSSKTPPHCQTWPNCLSITSSRTKLGFIVFKMDTTGLYR